MNSDDYDSSLPEGLDLRALSAFVDGELPGAERAAIEGQLKQHPQAAARVAAWRAQKAALRALCGAPQRSERDARNERREDDAADEPAFIVLRRKTPWWQRAGV
ncbi:MAG TPA: zf-HC2 domain-containing protein, partial [Dokdonella sp.]